MEILPNLFIVIIIIFDIDHLISIDYALLFKDRPRMKSDFTVYWYYIPSLKSGFIDITRTFVFINFSKIFCNIFLSGHRFMARNKKINYLSECEFFIDTAIHRHKNSPKWIYFGHKSGVCNDRRISTHYVKF